MPIIDPAEMAFERAYKSKFLALGAPFGVAIEYRLDVDQYFLGHVQIDTSRFVATVGQS
jgi:hypothetical protein